MISVDSRYVIPFILTPLTFTSPTEKRGDAEQAMGWFADSMRLRDVINLVTSIEIPLPDSPDSLDDNDELLDGPTIMPK